MTFVFKFFLMVVDDTVETQILLTKQSFFGNFENTR